MGAEFQERTVLVAADIDFGHACVSGFAADGARVVAIDSRSEALEVACSEVRANGGDATLLVVNSWDFDALQAVAGKLDQPIHVLVNCHHAVERATFADSSIETWQRMFAVNAFGPIFATKAFLPLLRRASGASVVQIGSSTEYLATRRFPPTRQQKAL